MRLSKRRMKKLFICLCSIALLISCEKSSIENTVDTNEDSPLNPQLAELPSDLRLLFSEPTQEACESFALIDLVEISLENNTWNAANLNSNSYRQCINTASITNHDLVGWQWSYPDDAHGINAYPELIYGKKPWHNRSTTSDIPKQIATIERLKVRYKATISRNQGEYNLAFDNWISSSANSRPEDIQFEFMIWEDAHEIRPFGDYRATVATSQGNYRLYTGEPDWEPAGSNWTYLAFVRENNRTEGIVDIDELLDYLVLNDIVPEDSYLSSIEFGTEVGNSKGYAVIEEFSIDLQ